MDIGDDVPEFLYDDPETKSFEIQWWRTCVAIRRHRISAYPRVDAIWSKLSQIAVAPCPITPRFIKYIEDLGNKHMNQPSFWNTIRTLRAQQDFEGLLAEIGEPTPQFIDSVDKHPAVPILQVLLTDGLISPAAAAWLAIVVCKDNEMYATYVPLFIGYSAIRRKVWNDRNVHLAACAENAKGESKDGSVHASQISAAEARDTYASVNPGTLKHVFEKQMERQKEKLVSRKVDKSSGGSKRSRHLQGKPLGEDKPIEEAEETTSKALAGLLWEKD